MASAPRFLPSTRREFIHRSTQGIGLLAFGHFAPSFLVTSARAAAPAAEKDRSILVLVQLAGGNDGLNTVIPFEDSRYYAMRPSLAVARKDVLPIGPTTGLHPALTPLRSQFEAGNLGIIQNVGYPNPNRSHFRSSEIWETGSDSNDYLSSGWVGRFLDSACAGVPADAGPVAVHVGNEVPQAFHAVQSHSTFGVSPNLRPGRRGRQPADLLSELAGTSLSPDGPGNQHFLRQTMMDALVTEKKVVGAIGEYRSEVDYPAHEFSRSLRSVAALIAAGFPTRVYFVSLGGFDTHSNQAGAHQNLLRVLSEGLAAFQRDLTAHRLDQQVLTMTFSEFGRRPHENQSRGTDHGTAAPLFVLGTGVKGGLHGTAPELGLERNQDLSFSTDFRQVYATVLDRWLGCPPAPLLDGAFRPLAFV